MVGASVKKVTLKIEGKEYDISLQDDIANAMEQIIASDFGRHANLGVKELLHAYIKTSIEKQALQQEIDAIHARIRHLSL